MVHLRVRAHLGLYVAHSFANLPFIRPFHAAVGILTTRMLLNIRKATATEVDGTLVAYSDEYRASSTRRNLNESTLPPLRFGELSVERF